MKMDGQYKLSVKISERSHRDLKILSAITRRPMGDLVEGMISDLKKELTGGRDWPEETDRIIEGEREAKKPKRAFANGKMKAEHKRRVTEIISRLRDEDGMTFDAIASKLTKDGYTTLTDKGEWKIGSVHRLYKERKQQSGLPTVMELINSNAPKGETE
jgi:hypothetical protein